MDRRSELSQFFTPLWVAEALIERYFPKLDASDTFLEPACGEGGFLDAVAPEIPAFGVEIDPEVAQRARARTGRDIIIGDFRSAEISLHPTAIVGNPPFRAGMFDGFLDRCYALLPEGARAGFILPTYFFQTASRVANYGERWSVEVDIIPRNAFYAGMKTPLVFAVFSKDRTRSLVGLALHRETDDLRRMSRAYRDMLAAQDGSAWRAVCELAITRLGGRAALQDIYREIEGNRPTRTPWWREQVRKTLRRRGDRFVPVGDGVYAMRMALVA